MENIKEYSLYAITPKDYKDFYLNYQKRKKSYLFLKDKEFPKINNYSKSLKDENLSQITKNLINSNPKISLIKLKDTSTDNFNSKTYHYSINLPFSKTERNIFPRMSPIQKKPKIYKHFRTKITKKDGLLSIQNLDLIKTNSENKILIYEMINKNEKIFKEELNDNIIDNSTKEKILNELKKIDESIDKQIENIIVNTTSQEKEDSIKYLQTQPKMIYIGAKEILNEIKNKELTSDIYREKDKDNKMKIKNKKMNNINDIFFDYAKKSIKRKIELRNQFNQEISLQYIENLLKNEIRKIVFLLSFFDIDVKSENNTFFPKGINTSSSFLIKDLKNKFGINILSKSFKKNLKFFNCHKSLLNINKKSRNIQNYGLHTQSKYNINIIDKSKFDNNRYNTENEYRKQLIDQLTINNDDNNKNNKNNILNNKINNNYSDKISPIKSPKDKGIFYFYNKKVISPREKLIKYESLRKKNNLFPLKIKGQNDDNNKNNLDLINNDIKSYNNKDININDNIGKEDKTKCLEVELENNKINSIFNKGIIGFPNKINKNELNKNNDILNLKVINFNKKEDVNENKEKNNQKLIYNKNKIKIDKNEDKKIYPNIKIKNEEQHKSEIIIKNNESKKNEESEESESSESSEDSEESEEPKINQEIQNKNDYMIKNEITDSKKINKSINININNSINNSINNKNKINNINMINKNNINNKKINKYNNYKHIQEIEEIDSFENSSSKNNNATISNINSVKKSEKKVSEEIQNEKSKSSKKKKKKKKAKKKSTKTSPNKKSNKSATKENDLNSEIKNKIDLISHSFKVLAPIKRRNSVIFSIKTPIVFNPKFDKIEKTLKRSFSEGDITTEKNEPDQVNIIKLHDDDIQKIVDYVNKEEKRRMETEGNEERNEKGKNVIIPEDNLNPLFQENNEESNRNKGELTKDDLIAKLKKDDFKIREYIEGIIRAGLIKRDKQLNKQMKNNSILVYKNFNLGLFRFNKNFQNKDEIELVFHRPLSHREENINQNDKNKKVITKTRTKIGIFEKPKKELIFNNSYLFSKKKNVNFILRKEVEEILNGGLISQLNEKKEEKKVKIKEKKKEKDYSKKDFIKKKSKHKLFSKSIFLNDLIELGEIKRKKEEDAKLKEIKRLEELREQNLDNKIRIFIDRINRLKSQDVNTGVGKEEIDEYINQIMKNDFEKNKENRLKLFMTSLNDYILATEKHREIIDTYLYKEPNLIRNLMVEDLFNSYNKGCDIGIEKDKSLRSDDMKCKFKCEEKNINDKNNKNDKNKKEKSYITEINC